jgi:hypothetical protein
MQEPRPWPPRARKEDLSRRFTVSHGATGSALDLYSRRSCGYGHPQMQAVIGTCEARTKPEVNCESMAYRRRTFGLDLALARR